MNETAYIDTLPYSYEPCYNIGEKLLIYTCVRKLVVYFCPLLNIM